MKTKALIWYGLSLVSLAVALLIFFKWLLNLKGILFLVLGLGAVLLYRQGLAEWKKKQL
jgi:hypothetical protein